MHRRARPGPRRARSYGSTNAAHHRRARPSASTCHRADRKEAATHPHPSPTPPPPAARSQEREPQSQTGQKEAWRAGSRPHVAPLPAWRHIDLAVHAKKHLVVLELAKKIRAQAHERGNANVAQPVRNQLRKTASLAALSMRVKLLALINVKKESRRFGLPKLGVAPFRLVNQIGKLGFTIENQLHPFVPALQSRSITDVKSPGFQESLDQRLEWLDPRV